MNAKYRSLLVAAAVLGAAASFALAGPGTPIVNRVFPVAKSSMVASPAKAAAMTCSACQTTPITVRKHFGQPGRGIDSVTTVGVKHTCSHCTGEIAITQGHGTDTMKGNCAMCGAGAALCHAAVAEQAKN